MATMLCPLLSAEICVLDNYTTHAKLKDEPIQIHDLFEFVLKYITSNFFVHARNIKHLPLHFCLNNFAAIIYMHQI